MPSAVFLHLNQVQGEGGGGCSPVLDAQSIEGCFFNSGRDAAPFMRPVVKATVRKGSFMKRRLVWTMASIEGAVSGRAMAGTLRPPL